MVDENIQSLVNLFKSGELETAKEKALKEIEKKPNNFFLHNILGAILAAQKKLNEASDSFKKSIKINPNFAEAYSNLGAVLFKLKRVDESVKTLNQAIRINPNFAEPYLRLGSIFQKQFNRINESILCYQKAVEIKPDYQIAYEHLANIFKEIGEIKEAINNYERIIQINSNSEMAYINLANLYVDIGKVESARKLFRKLISLKPNNLLHKINNALIVTPILQSNKEIDSCRNEYIKNLKNLKKSNEQIPNPGYSIESNFFYLAFHNKNNLKIMKNTSDIFRKILPNINYVSKNINKLKKQSKIRIGFISEFLTDHTIGKLFGGLIKNIDREKFDVIIVHTSETKQSKIKKEMDDSANKVVILKNNIEDQQKQIENESFDIIFYPEIAMSPRVYFLAFSRLAPAQVVSWGHPETTGINTIDYFLSSVLFERKNSSKKYSENLVCLKEFPLYYDPPKNIKPLLGRSNFNLPKKNHLYGCPQSLFKLHPDFDEILAKILEKDPEGYIVFIGGKNKHEFWAESLKKRWSKTFPILNKKVFFTKRLSLNEFISLCNCVDVLLDPIYFGGGNTFLESMIVGTPTITMPGTYLKANITAAAYKQMKIANSPIVKNPKEYVNLAVELAKNQKKNLLLRKNLKKRANKYLYKNSKTLKQFEKFLIQINKTSQAKNNLKDGCIIK